jgi:putative membrane protein
MLWVKAFHIISMVCWFAGIFYLPRLFVNHAMVEDAATRERLALMERKLYRFITPFMLLTVILGGVLVVKGGFWDQFAVHHWLHAKLTLVLLLCGYHGWMGATVRAFAAGKVTRSHKFYRVMNELPVLLLFAIVILVVVKPF